MIGVPLFWLAFAISDFLDHKKHIDKTLYPEAFDSKGNFKKR